MRVSIVTLSFNQRDYLADALESVLAQDYDDVEYIVVDPGSTDGSREVIKRYRHRLAHVVYDRDDGPADGLNRGFSVASGEICGYLNADDYFLPGAVHEAVDVFRADPTAAAVWGHGIIVGPDRSPIRRFRSTPLSARRYVYGEAVVMQQATFFRRSAWEAVGGFNAENRTCWDGEFLLALARGGFRTRRVNRTWGAFRIHPSSISGSRSLEAQYLRDCARMFTETVGRQPSAVDRLLMGSARFRKWMRDPVGVAWAVQDRLARRAATS